LSTNVSIQTATRNKPKFEYPSSLKSQKGKMITISLMIVCMVLICTNDIDIAQTRNLNEIKIEGNDVIPSTSLAP